MRKNVMLSSFLAMLIWGLLALGPGAPLAGPLDEIIAGSKKEGQVSIMLSTGFTPKSMGRLEREIRDLYGVDLKIKFTPVGSMPKAMAEALMEHKVGAPPTYDLMGFGAQVAAGMKAGIFERVDWKPIATKDTNPQAILKQADLFGAMIFYTSYLGLMYNPEKIPANDVPKTLKDLGNPKWKNKVGIPVFSSIWARWANILGKERVLSDLRGIIKNGAIQGRYVNAYNRYLLGEIYFAFLITSYFKQAQNKGMPAAWQSLDFAEIREFSVVIRKGARNPNSAKLLGVFFGSPQGAKLTLEESGSGNRYYPGNYEHDIALQNKRQGIREVLSGRNPELIAFSTSKKNKQWKKEVQLILQTGARSKGKKKK